MTKKLRTGFTTGTAAAAAAKGALLMILEKKAPSHVPITLTTGDTLKVAIHSCTLNNEKQATCTVIKDAGDDPDVTHKAEIGAIVKLLEVKSGPAQKGPQRGGVSIAGGQGVGRITKPGLEVPPGEPAINPGPRKMIHRAVDEVFASYHIQRPIHVEIFVPEGKKLAEKTLNPRLGILGGISILGTTGIVRPMSHDAFIATIESALSVACATGVDHVILTTGRRSERFAQSYWPQLPVEAFIQIGDFFKMSLASAAKRGIRHITLAVFFGKAIKMAQGFPHTHAARARLTMRHLYEWSLELTGDSDFSQSILAAHSARHAFEIIKENYPHLIHWVGKRIVASAKKFVPAGVEINSVIFDYKGETAFDCTKDEGMNSSMNPVNIIGMGMGPRDLTGSHLQLIEQADILMGGKRLLDYFKDTAAQKKPIGRKVDDSVDFIKKKMKTKKIVVLASGDPLFYGIGGTLTAALGSKNVCIHPNVSTVAAAFARIKEPWNDVRVISMHGPHKTMRQLCRTLEKEDKIAVLTDPKNNPARLAQWLIEKEMVDFQMCVLEAMGSPSERFNWYSLNQATTMAFADPNLVVLKRGAQDSDINMNLHFGMPDSWFVHQTGLITKSEVRAVSLSKLKLLPDHTLWDLGAGSGSISVEAAVFVKTGKIFAVENRPERIEQIMRNKQRFKVKNLNVIQSDLPEGLINLPSPDRIFIGGGGKNLKSIIISASGRLKVNGIIVINTVLIANLQIARETLQQSGFHTDIVQVHISRGADMPWSERLEAQNPVWIIRGSRIAN